MDLLPVFALKPTRYAGQLRRRHNPPVSEDLDQKGFLVLRPSNRQTKVHMMKAQHTRSVPGGRRVGTKILWLPGCRSKWFRFSSSSPDQFVREPSEAIVKLSGRFPSQHDT